MDPTRAASVATTFALGEPAGPATFVARGSMGELWRLRTVDGRTWAVKTLFGWGDPEPTGRDVALQHAAAGAGIALPAPCRAVDGRIVVNGVRVYEWVDLAPLPWPPDAATVEEAGRILGALHALALAPDEGEEVDEWYRTAPEPSLLADLAERGRRAGRPWAAPVLDRLGLLTELHAIVRAAAASPPTDVIVCHRDFTPDNVFRPADGGALVVVDWENAGALSAEAELAATVATWCGSADPRPLLDGYAAGGGTASIAGPASFATNTATRLNYLRVMAEQSLADDEHRAFADAALVRLVDDELDDAVPRGWRT